MMENLLTYHRRHFSYPTYMEIMADAELLKAGVTRVLTKEQIIYMLDKRIIEAEIKHELLLAFQVFDTENRNFLELGELEAIVTGYGDAFNREETLELLRDANVRGDGNIVYENFVESLFAMAPELYEITIFCMTIPMKIHQSRHFLRNRNLSRNPSLNLLLNHLRPHLLLLHLHHQQKEKEQRKEKRNNRTVYNIDNKVPL
ncbi:calmodulin-like isoform X3 [Leguminivora glycinivorella]|uniref:calmodulin-like isoform X3 n=1 Tax=Leguminivora glycinivorella TaxID=1035111 RepID=UPI00200C74BC|nr:calmodulin-like isoform X3 [Leguminivora glycinivorella]